jgi:16S rRNA (cytosine967-C5)-methyltransferase
VRWRRTPDDVPPLVELQTALLDSALASVRVGGVVAYVTCSPHTAETHGTLNAALRRWGSGIRQLDTQAVVQGVARHPLDLAGAPETAQLWPHRHGTDAMFVALVQRTTTDAPEAAR